MAPSLRRISIRPTGPMKDLLAYMAERSRRPLSSYTREWKPVPQKMVEIPPPSRRRARLQEWFASPAADYDFQVRGIEIEGGNDPGVDVQYPWEDIARRNHRHRIHLSSFYIDRTPVTNAEFKRFLDATQIPPEGRPQFSARLEKRKLSRWRQETCDLGLD